MDAVRGEEYTMSEARAMSRSFGHALINLGAQRGDVVAVILPNMPEYAFRGGSEGHHSESHLHAK